jgi:wyosine [tRNA(Phe)-imidazoG37] synthetase (radical SAM superfamily)
MKERVVYGPVPSRRLGQSLGVDPVPHKTCNYNCVYCQLGRTTPITNERRDFFPPREILTQLVEALGAHRPGEIDYVTFTGQGEPTMCASLGWLIRQAKAVTNIPVAVIANGALLVKSDVREELAAADVVIPTLDAADQETFREINRPWPGFLIADIIDGMIAFRDRFAGKLWIEVMLVKDLNDDEPRLLKLRGALAHIRPDRIQINVPIRPPAETWVEIPDYESVVRATAILGEAAEAVAPYEGSFDLSGFADAGDAALTIICRHPMRERSLRRALDRFAPREVDSTLAQLEAESQA